MTLEQAATLLEEGDDDGALVALLEAWPQLVTMSSLEQRSTTIRKLGLRTWKPIVAFTERL